MTHHVESDDEELSDRRGRQDAQVELLAQPRARPGAETRVDEPGQGISDGPGARATIGVAGSQARGETDADGDQAGVEVVVIRSGPRKLIEGNHVCAGIVWKNWTSLRL